MISSQTTNEEKQINNFELICQLAKDKNKSALDKLICVDVQQGIHTPVSLLAKEGDVASARLLIQAGANPNWAIMGAAEAGNTNFVNELFSQGASMEWALRGAARRGDGEELIITFIEKIKALQQEQKDISTEKENLNWAKEGAAEGGHKELVNTLLTYDNELTYVARGAAAGDKFEMFRDLLGKDEKGVIDLTAEGASLASRSSASLIAMLAEGAGIAGRELMITMLQDSANYLWVFTGMAKGQGENSALISQSSLILDLLSPNKENYNTMLAWVTSGAAKGGHIQLLNSLLERDASSDLKWKSATDQSLIDYAAIKAAQAGHEKLAVNLLERGADFNLILNAAAESDHFKNGDPRLRFLSLVDDIEVRKNLASTITTSEEDLLNSAAEINNLMKSKSLSLDEALKLSSNKDVQELFDYFSNSQTTSFDANLVGIITSYMTESFEQKEGTDLFRKEKDSSAAQKNITQSSSNFFTNPKEQSVANSSDKNRGVAPKEPATNNPDQNRGGPKAR